MPHLLFLFMCDFTLLLGNMKKPRYGLLAKGQFHKVPKLFGPFSGAAIAFLSSQRCGSKLSNFAILLDFLKLKNMLKDQQVDCGMTTGFSGPKCFWD